VPVLRAITHIEDHCAIRRHHLPDPRLRRRRALDDSRPCVVQPRDVDHLNPQLGMRLQGERPMHMDGGGNRQAAVVVTADDREPRGVVAHEMDWVQRIALMGV